MKTQTNALIAPKPFALICSFKAPTTDLSPDFVASVSVCVGTFATAEQGTK